MYKTLNLQELSHIRMELENVPEEKWTITKYLDGDGKSDALGHLGRRVGKPHPELTLKLNATCVKHMGMLVQDINDCPDWHPQAMKKFGKYKSPKERVIAAMKQLQQMYKDEGIK